MATSKYRILIVMALLLSAAVVTTPASAAWPGNNGRIVGVEPRYDMENCETGGTCPSLGKMIVSQQRDGGDPVDLALGDDPSWDADGKRVVYSTPSYAIFRINADGTGKRRVTSTQAESGEDEFIDRFPGWSPTGNRVVFQRTSQAGEVNKVMIANVDGTPAPQTVTSGQRPEWSSRGTIAYLRTVDGIRRIYTIRPDGEDRAVVPKTHGATDVTWAPNGMRLAFVTPGDEGAECVHVVGIDGSNHKDIACGFRGTDGGGIRGIAWAPDGNGLLVGIQDFNHDPVYASGRMVRVLLDGSKWRMDAVGFSPDWQPKN